MTATAERWYVHYTVKTPPDFIPKYCTAGPYTVDEVTGERRDIASYANITDCYVSTDAKHPKA